MRKSSADLTEEEFNEPVCYCHSCHSLYILVDDTLADSDWDGSYCGRCFSSDIRECKLGEWMQEEERRAETRRQIEWNK